MNIESATSASLPQRTPLPEASAKAARPIAEQGKLAVAVKSADTTKSLPAEEEENTASALSVEDAVKRLSSFVASTQSEISFSIDEASGIRVVKIMDTESNKVIRQFPSEEAIKIASALDQLQGLLIRDKA